MKYWRSPSILVLALCFSSSVLAASHGGPITARGVPSPTPAVVTFDANLQKRGQIVFQVCPEQINQPRFRCDDARCGGNTKVPGICDNILLNGPQQGCQAPGCGTYCQCDNPTKPPPPGQVVFQVCPEALGKAPTKCSDCGGDSHVPGVCNNVLINGPQRGCINPGGCGYYCQCTADGNDKPVVTTTANGKTATATFTPCTFSQYSSLRASTTITTQTPPLQTKAPTVVYAGGVGWCIAAIVGPVGLIPLGPPVLPEGAKEDDATCHPEPKCEDQSCGGKNPLGLCSSGSNQGCPCQEEKQQCPNEPPKCSDAKCGGDNGNHQCLATGTLKDCQCCPDELPCSSKDCSGKDEKCTADTFKGCSCQNDDFDVLVDPDDTPYISSGKEMDALAQQILNEFYHGDINQLMGGATRAHPADNPGCHQNTAGSIPAQVLISGGTTTPKDLHYRMRETLCNNGCGVPKDVPPSAVVATKQGDLCEIAIVLPNNIEAWAVRDTQSTGPEWQDCWDSFMNITEKCDLSKPNTGWVNGPDPYEFFQNGYRPLNDPSAKHTSIDPAHALQTPGTQSPPASQTVIGITPTSTSFQCVDNTQGGWMGDCWGLASKFQPDEQICTNDPKYCPDSAKGQSYCKAKGGRCDPNGSSTMAISSFCTVASFQSCAIVIADKLASFGFPGSSCIKGSDIAALVALEQTTNGCGGLPEQGKIALLPASDGTSTLCMAGSEAPGLCAA